MTLSVFPIHHTVIKRFADVLHLLVLMLGNIEKKYVVKSKKLPARSMKLTWPWMSPEVVFRVICRIACDREESMLAPVSPREKLSMDLLNFLEENISYQTVAQSRLLQQCGLPAD